MSDSSEGDERKVESTSRMWAESQPGPSRCQPSRQGYCGYCRVLYSNLDQHLSSLRHLDSVRASSRGSSTVSSSASSSRTQLTLLERFLQDVLQHHPHRYNDPRPSHADLPSVYDPPLPRAELDDFFSDNDSRSLGTQEHPSGSEDASCRTANQIEADHAHSQSGEGVTEDAGQRSLSAPIREQEGGGSHSRHTQLSQVQTPPPQHQTPPPVHRKAHRKTNRWKTSSSSTSPPHRGPDRGSSSAIDLGPRPGPGPRSGPGPGPRPCWDPRPWLNWQKERREARREEAFSSDHSDSLDRTIEEVIQRCCHGVTPCQQEETESFHFSLVNSMESQSDIWDTPLQRDATPVQVSQTDGQDLSHLMDTQVDLEDQTYSHQLESALHSKQQARSGAKQDQGFWTLPIEEVLPAPQHIPESFRGKTWTQIEQEDEEKVEKLVRQFRQERFICYFDSESLARYGRRSQHKEVEPDTCALPLLDHDDDDSAYVRRRRRRAFRVASRCQVVKVSHSTQTVHLVVPAVLQPASGAPPTSIPDTNQEAAETPAVQTWHCLPPSYSNVVTPLQSRTSLVYLLCSPSGPASTCPPAPDSALKRCRKKRRPLDPQGVKVKYKQLPVRFYDPSNNRILKNPPRGFLWRQRLAPSGPPPPCVRQLFRSLSPDLNADMPLGEGTAGSSRVKGQRSSDSFLLNTLSVDSAQTDKQHTFRRRSRTSQAPPPPLHSRSERGRAARRTRPLPSKKTTRAQATPTQPRREGLRRAGPGRTAPGSTDRRGRGRRGRR